MVGVDRFGFSCLDSAAFYCDNNFVHWLPPPGPRPDRERRWRFLSRHGEGPSRKSFSHKHVGAVDRPSGGVAAANRARAFHQHPEIVTHHAPTDPASHAVHATITAARQTVAALEHADASLAADSPPLPAAKPALPLLGRLLGLQFAERRNAHFFDPLLLGCALVGGRPKAPVCGQQMRRPAKGADVGLNRRHYQRLVLRTLVVYLIIDHVLILGFLDLEQLAKFGRLGRFTLANRFGVRLEQAEELVGIMRVIVKDARLSLGNYAVDQRHKVLQYCWSPSR